MRMLFKAVGLIVILCTCTAAGFLKAVSLKNRLESLKTIKNGLSKLKERLRLHGGDKQRLINACFSSPPEMLSDLKLKKLSPEFLNAVQNGMPILLNTQEGSSLFALVKDFDFEFYSLCAVSLEREERVGYLLLLSTDKTQKFQTETLDILSISKDLIEGIL